MTAPDPSHVEHKLPKSVVDAVTYLVATSYDAGKHGATDSSSVRDACEELGFAIASELAVLQRRCGKAEALLSEAIEWHANHKHDGWVDYDWYERAAALADKGDGDE